MVYMDAKKTSYFVVVAAWLAVFCLFGYRSTFAILAGPMSQTMGWTGAQVSLGYSLMMSIYAITAFFSGMILDKWGTKPVYTIAAVFCMLGFYLTANVESLYSYYAAYAIFAGIGTGMLWVSSTIPFVNGSLENIMPKCGVLLLPVPQWRRLYSVWA